MGKVGIELHAVLEFFNMTIHQAVDLVRILKEMKAPDAKVADAQLHSKSYTHSVLAFQDNAGLVKDTRQVSVFIRAANEAVAKDQLQMVYRKLNATVGYGCEIVTGHVMK